jgi:site-specific recombinase XerD
MISDIEARFFNYLRVERGLSPNTLVAYKNDIEKLNSFAGGIGKDLASLEREDLVKYTQHLQYSESVGNNQESLQVPCS